MSLGYLFKRMAREELGMFSAYERNYIYKFITPESAVKHWDMMAKKMSHWKREALEHHFPIKKDDRGRDCILHFVRSMPCLLESNFENHAVKNGFALVPKSVCAKCPHRKMTRRKYYCEKLREKNKGLTAQVVETAMKNTENIFGK